MCRLLIVDDKNLTDNSLKDIIDWKSIGCDIFDVVYDGNEAINIIRENSIDIVITEINIIGLDGLNLISEIKKMNIKSKIIVVSNNLEYQTIRWALKNGAMDYLVRDIIDINEVNLLIKKINKNTSTNKKSSDYISNLLKKVFKGENVDSEELKEKLSREESEILKKPYRIIFFKKEDGFLLNEFINNILNESKESFINIIPIYLNNNNVIIIFNEVEKEKIINIVTKNIYKIKQNNNSNIYAVLSDICDIDYDICNLLKNTISKMDYCFYSFKNYVVQDKIIKTNENNIKYRKEVEDIISYIDSNIQNKITLKMLSNDINMNESYLSRMFKRETGKNIIFFINERKMEKAMELLSDESILIKQVSKAVGIEDQFYFNKLFKKFYNITPSDFKKKIIL